MNLKPVVMYFQYKKQTKKNKEQTLKPKAAPSRMLCLWVCRTATKNTTYLYHIEKKKL